MAYVFDLTEDQRLVIEFPDGRNRVFTRGYRNTVETFEDAEYVLRRYAVVLVESPEDDPVPAEEETPVETTESAVDVVTAPTDVSGDRVEQLVAAVRALMEEGKVLKSGKPSVSAVEDLVGFEITAEERDAAYEAVVSSD